MGSDSIDAGNGRRLTRDSVPISASIESDPIDASLRLAGSQERLPAAIFGFWELTSRRFDTGYQFMEQQ